jgi:hypothetical protein
LRQPPDKQRILDSLAAIARGADRPPSRSEFLSLSGISEHSVLQFFPSWNAALRAAGLQPYTLNLRLEDRELLEDWGHAVRRNHKIPTRRVYRHLGKFDTRTFERRFGPWSQLPQVFRNFAKSKPEWADVLALLPTPAPKPSPKRVPTSPPNSAPSPASHSAVAQALLPVRLSPSNKNSAPNRQPPPTPPPAKLRYPPLDGRPTYGQPMDFRGLRHEPVNEQGVVLLFGMVAKELATPSKPCNPASRTAKPSARSPRIAGSASISNSNLRAAISATTATPSPAATSSSAGATTGPTALPTSKSSNSPP